IGGWPDEDSETTRYALEIPGGLSFLATGDVQAEVTGLSDVPRALWPPVEITHLAFQLMVASGMVLLVLSAWFWWVYARRRAALLTHRRLLWALVLGTPLGFLGLEAGWFVTEVGRQPWIIQGVMKIDDAVTPAPGVLGLFIGFTLLYAVLGTTVVVLLRRLAAKSET